jgi:hypothetical protein
MPRIWVGSESLIWRADGRSNAVAEYVPACAQRLADGGKRPERAPEPAGAGMLSIAAFGVTDVRVRYLLMVKPLVLGYIRINAMLLVKLSF